MPTDLPPEPTPQSTAGQEAALFAEAVAIMARLRGPDGCPWDREQTPETVRKYTLEETYEVLDAIERKNPADVCEELGDLLLQVLFYAQMAAETGEFSIADVIAGLNRKLIRRHPHVFGESAAREAGNQAVLSSTGSGIASKQVLLNWNAIKKMENKSKAKDEEPSSRLHGVLRAQPALVEADKLGAAAAKCGFDWPDTTGVLAKIAEEAAEVATEINAGEAASPELQMEVGDLLFVTANLARHLKVNPELALRDANAKFRSRFTAMERTELGGKPLEACSLEELEALWQEAKRGERETRNNS